jgi:hypothetical protein
MDEQQFLTPKDLLGYAEEHIVCGQSQNLRMFSLSNSLDDIKIAIYARTGLNIDLDNAYWQLLPSLSTSIRHLMNKHRVTYSMDTYYIEEEEEEEKKEEEEEEKEEKMRFIFVFMHVGNKWFCTSYCEQDSVIYNNQKDHLCYQIKKILRDPNIDDPYTAINELLK